MRATRPFNCCGVVATAKVRSIRRLHKGRYLLGEARRIPPEIIINLEQHRTFSSLVDTVLHEALHLASDTVGLNISESRVARIAAAQRNALKAVLGLLKEERKKKAAKRNRGR